MAVVKCKAIHDKPKATIKYILNPEKTKNGELVSGINTIPTPELADKKMTYYRNKYKSSNNIKAMHIIHSFSDKENITAEQAHEISLEWFKRVFPSSSLAVVATHIKRDNVEGEKCFHTHFLVNNVCINGEKIRTDKEWIKNAIDISNQICEKYNLKYSFIRNEKLVPNKNWYEWQQENAGNSWKQKIRENINELIKCSNSFENLLEQLRDKGYEIKTGGKYIAVKPPGKTRFVRLKTLGYYYSEEKIIERINKKEEQDLEGIGYKTKKKFIDYDVYRFRYKKGTIGNIIQLTGLIIKAQLGLDSNNKFKYQRHNYKSEQELELISKALETVDKYKIEQREDVIKIYTEVEKELVRLNKWKTKAQKRIEEIESIAEKINELNLIKEKNIEVDRKIEEDKNKEAELKELVKTYDRCIARVEEKEKESEINKENNEDKGER